MDVDAKEFSLKTRRLLAALLLAATASAADWPDYRGSDRRGEYAGPALSAERMAGSPAPDWTAEIGDGHASVSVAEGRVFAFGRRDGLQTVVSLDAETGDTLWTHAWESDFGGFRGLLSGVVGSGKGPRATPVWSDSRVHVLGPGGELRCLDAGDGRLLWRRNVLDDAEARNDVHGVAATPLVVGDSVVALLGGKADRLVRAYDKATGEPRWSSLGGDGSYASPMLASLAGMPQVVVVTDDGVAGLAPDDGALLWRLPRKSTESAAQPVIVDDRRLFVSDGSGGMLVELTRGADGLSASVVWETRAMKNQISSSVRVGGFLYGIDGKILACVDLETGERVWKGGRYGRGQVLRAGDRLLVVAESGEVALVAASSEGHRELARFQAFDEKTFTVPAISDGRVFVRAGEWLASYDLRGEDAQR